MGAIRFLLFFVTLGVYDSKRKSIWCFPLPKDILYACYYQINMQCSISLSLVFSEVVKIYLLLIFILVRYFESEFETVIQWWGKKNTLVLLFFSYKTYFFQNHICIVAMTPNSNLQITYFLFVKVHFKSLLLHVCKSNTVILMLAFYTGFCTKALK